MKFNKPSDIKLLNTCLSIHELLLTAKLHSQRNRLEQCFSRTETSRINRITEAIYNSYLEETEPAQAFQNDFLRFYRKAVKFDVENDDPKKSTESTFKKYMDASFSLYEIKRLRAMNTDFERISTLNSHNDEPELAPTDFIANFSNYMLEHSDKFIAKAYIDKLEKAKSFYRLTDTDSQLFESLGILQKHLEHLAPMNISGVKQKSDLEIVYGRFMDDLESGNARLAVANLSKTHTGRKSLWAALALGLISTCLVTSLYGQAKFGPTNNSTFQEFSKAGALSQVFSDEELNQITYFESQFKQCKEGTVPSNVEFSGLLNSLDNFYSDTIKEKLLAAYNEYAEQNNLPQALHVSFRYNDYDMNSGKRNILKVYNESRETLDIDMDGNSLFDKNGIREIYEAERRIDKYKRTFEADHSAATKTAILSSLETDFYDVLDACTLGYSYQEAGLLKKFFGKELVLTESSVLEEAKKDAQMQSNNNSISQQVESEIIDNGRNDDR